MVSNLLLLRINFGQQFIVVVLQLICSCMDTFLTPPLRLSTLCRGLKTAEKDLVPAISCTTYLGIENDVIPNVAVQVATMYCNDHFSPKVAKRLHSTNKNTKKKTLKPFDPGSIPGRCTKIFIFKILSRTISCEVFPGL